MAASTATALRGLRVVVMWRWRLVLVVVTAAATAVGSATAAATTVIRRHQGLVDAVVVVFTRGYAAVAAAPVAMLRCRWLMMASVHHTLKSEMKDLV